MRSPDFPSADVIPAIAVIAALPREIAALVKGLQEDAELVRHGIHLYRRQGAVVAAAGMGAARVAMAVQAARSAGPVTTLISAGLAGACSPELHAGAVVEAHRVIDARTGERFAANAGREDRGGDHRGGSAAVLVTAETIASVQEKKRLAATYGAALVDMEAATVARLAAAHGLGFRAIKGISDAYDFELASLARFAGRRGSFRTAAFALHTATHPREWGRAARLGRDSSRALAALNAALLAILSEGVR